MLFSHLKRSVLLGVFTTIELFWTIDLALAERISIDSNTRQSIEINGSGNASITAVSITDDLSTTTGACSGFVSQKADHTLVLNSFVNMLQISVISSHDTTLIVKGPGGTWCNDDYRSKNPQIVGQWQPGTYSIWIGSYSQNTPFTYRLKIKN
jgi:hypothetical protein